MKGNKNDEIKITAKFISGWINFKATETKTERERS